MDVIARHILIQAEAGPAAVVTVALRDRLGASEAASGSGCRDVIARAGTGDTGELARPVASRARAPAPGRGR